MYLTRPQFYHFSQLISLMESYIPAKSHTIGEVIKSSRYARNTDRTEFDDTAIWLTMVSAYVKHKKYNITTGCFSF